jgi:signal transduction histidine kinase
MTAQPHPTVLYVDDDADDRHQFRWIFQQAGFDVKEAATGDDALRLVREAPDVIVLDINLPDINGFEVCRRIKSHPATRAIPVLHLSAAYVTARDRAHGLEEGADGYLTKPVEPQELVAQVKALVRIHQAEERARTALLQWQATFDAISDGVCLLSPEGAVLRCNRALAQLLDRPAADLTGRALREVLAGSQPPGEGPFERVLHTRTRASAEMVLGERSLQGTADPVLAADGTVCGAVYILSDVTERKRLEEQLRQAQKMEAVGRLAGGIAHDFNNLLTGILGNLSLLLAGLPAEDPRRESLLAAEKLGWRAADLVRQLLGFSRRGVFRPRPVSVRDEADGLLQILCRVTDPRIRVEASFAPDLWPVLADPAQIGQVLMNLCLNARDAMPDGGELLVAADNVVVDEAGARLHAGGRAGRFVRLRVSDSGHGMMPAVRARIFEPFFTTKPVGKGSGLGLAMVFGIVQQHQGWIYCASAVGIGTTFDVYLPACHEEPAAAQGTATATGLDRGQGTILFADDEAAIRALGREWLEGNGYEVLLAADGREAVETYRQFHEQVSLVVLDLTMPHLSGHEVLRELVRTDPQVRVLCTSGYDAEQVTAAMSACVGFLPKPYKKEELLTAVQRVPREPAGLHP